MAGTMRKMGLYLGLLEDADTDEFEGQGDGYDQAHDRTHDGAPVRRTPRPAAPVAQLDDRRREAVVAHAPTPSTAIAGLSRITTLHPRTYNEARVIGENFRDGVPVIMNLSEMSDTEAKRLVDFAAGLVFAVHGSIERVTNKVFLLSPPNVTVAAEEKQRIAEGGFFNQS